MKSCLVTDLTDDGLRLELVLTVEATPAKLAELAAAVAQLVDHAHDTAPGAAPGAAPGTASHQMPTLAAPAAAPPAPPQPHGGTPSAPPSRPAPPGGAAVLARSPWFVFAADGDIPITVQCPACATRLPVASADERDVAPVRRDHVAEKPRCKRQLLTNGFGW